METALLAGGCFWGMQDLLRQAPGVLKTEVGYTGGQTPKPAYPQVKTGTTGHAEGRAGRVRSCENIVRRLAGTLVLSHARPDHQESPGQRRRHAVPFGHFLSVGRPKARRAGSHQARRRQVAAPDCHRSRARRGIHFRRRLPSGLSGKESGRVHLPLHAGLNSAMSDEQ